MNNEIKEILDKIKDGIGKFEEYDNNALLESDECEILLDYITKLQQERDKFKLRCFKAYKMIWDNYGVLDKYGIEMLEDILNGEEDE